MRFNPLSTLAYCWIDTCNCGAETEFEPPLGRLGVSILRKKLGEFEESSATCCCAEFTPYPAYPARACCVDCRFAPFAKPCEPGAWAHPAARAEMASASDRVANEFFTGFSPVQRVVRVGQGLGNSP